MLISFLNEVLIFSSQGVCVIVTDTQFKRRPANHFCLHAWATGSECLENVSDAWNSVTDLKLKGI